MSKVTVVSRPNRITIASKGVQGAVGPEGPRGLQGQEGEKGDTGDVTPEALAARDAAQGAASAAAQSAADAAAAFPGLDARVTDLEENPAFPDAPDDGGAYIRVNGAWVQLYAPLSLSGDLPDGTVDEPYTATLEASGGRPPYALGDVLLPPGLDATLADATVTVAGTPSEAWEGEAHIDLSDSLGTAIRRVLDARVVVPVFDPTMLPSLYAWFDPMDPGTKFQDEAGTTPVTAAGQPVLHLSDKSGNGRNATATSSANSPVDGAFASQPGAPAALAYNGTSSALVAHSIASLFNGASPQWTITVAVEHLSGTLLGAGYSGSTTTNEYLSASRGTGRFSLTTRHAGASLTIADAGPSDSLPDVITIRRNGASFDSWVNGVKEVTAGEAAPEASDLFDRFAIGANHRATIAAYFGGNIGEMIVSAIADSDTDVAKTQAYVMHRLSTAAIVDLFIVTGQSNAKGQGTAGGTVDKGWGYQVTDSGGMTKLIDPVEGAVLGSAWPAFARKWKDATGRASAWRNKAVSGSGLIKDNGTGHWGVTGALRAPAISSAAASYSALSGNWRYTLGNVYVCWQQGETDAGSYGGVFEGATVNAVNYKAAQIELFDHFFANIPSLDAIFVSELGEYVPTVAGFALIRQAQNEAVADTPNVHLVFNGAKDFPAGGMMKADGHHYTQPGYDAMGEGMAAGAAAIVYP